MSVSGESRFEDAVEDVESYSSDDSEEGCFWLPKGRGLLGDPDMKIPSGSGRGRGLLDLQQEYSTRIGHPREEGPLPVVRQEYPPSSGGAKVAKYKTLCPVRGCGVRTVQLKRHAFARHLSVVFTDRPSRGLMEDQQFHQEKGNVVRHLTDWLLGEEADVAELVGMANDRLRIPGNCKIPGPAMPALRKLCSQMGWERMKVYRLNPMNSPACLIYWRVLLAFFSFLSEEQIQVLRTLRFPAAVEEAEEVQGAAAPLIPAGHEDPVEEELLLDTKPQYREEEATSAIVSMGEEKPFRLQDVRTGRRVGVCVSSLEELRTACRDHFGLAGKVVICLEDGTEVVSSRYLHYVLGGTLLLVGQGRD